MIYIWYVHGTDLGEVQDIKGTINPIRGPIISIIANSFYFMFAILDNTLT